MDEITRRDALQRAAGLGLIGVTTTADAADGQPKPPETEKGRVMSVGMTEAEADCWLLAAQTAGKFFALPDLHPMDTQEVSSAIHIIQNKLLSRPTYRRYLEVAKAAEAERMKKQ